MTVSRMNVYRYHIGLLVGGKGNETESGFAVYFGDGSQASLLCTRLIAKAALASVSSRDSDTLSQCIGFVYFLRGSLGLFGFEPLGMKAEAARESGEDRVDVENFTP